MLAAKSNSGVGSLEANVKPSAEVASERNEVDATIKDSSESKVDALDSDAEPVKCRMGNPIADVRQLDADMCGADNPDTLPIDILSRDGASVTFALSQVWKECDGTTSDTPDIGWIAADYVVPTGSLECFKHKHAGCGVIATHTAKCTEGLALVELYLLNDSDAGLFSQKDGSALQIPDACAAPGDKKKACKFRYILTCMEPCEKSSSWWPSLGAISRMLQR